MAPYIRLTRLGAPIARASSSTPSTDERVEAVGCHGDPRPLVGVEHRAALEHGRVEPEAGGGERDGRSGDASADDE